MGCRNSKAKAVAVVTLQGENEQRHEQQQHEQDDERFGEDRLPAYQDQDDRGKPPQYSGKSNPFDQHTAHHSIKDHELQLGPPESGDGVSDLKCLIEGVGECDRAMKSCYDQTVEMSKSFCEGTASFTQSAMPECVDGTVSCYNECVEGCVSLYNSVQGCSDACVSCSLQSDLCSCEQNPCSWMCPTDEEDTDACCACSCWNPLECMMESTNREGNLKLYGDGERTAFHCNKYYEIHSTTANSHHASSNQELTLMEQKERLFAKPSGGHSGAAGGGTVEWKCTEWSPCPECKTYNKEHSPPPVRLNLFQCCPNELPDTNSIASCLYGFMCCASCASCCECGDDVDDGSSGVGDAMVSTDHFQRGDKVMYRGVQECTILERHIDDPMSIYYTVRLTSSGREVQTVPSHLSEMPPENTGSCCQSCCSCLFCCCGSEDSNSMNYQQQRQQQLPHQQRNGDEDDCCCSICNINVCCCCESDNDAVVNSAQETQEQVDVDENGSCCDCLPSLCCCCSCCCDYATSSYGATVDLLVSLKDYAEGYAASHRYQHLSPSEVYTLAVKQLTTESKSSFVDHFRSLYYYEKHPILGLSFNEAFGPANVCVRIDYRATFRFVSVIQAIQDYLIHRPGKYPRNQTFLWLDMLVSNPWSSGTPMVQPSTISVIGNGGDWKDVLVFERSSMYQSTEVSVDTLLDVIEGAQAFGSSSVNSDQAIALYDRALEELQHVYGEADTHKDTLLVLHKLSALLISKKRNEEAYKLLLREYATLERLKGIYDEKVISIQGKLGGVCQQLNRWDEARKWLEKCLGGKESVYGYNHEKTLITISHLAIVLKNLGDFDAAKAMFDRELSGCEAAHGVDHVSTLMTVYNIGNFYYGRLNYSEAFKYFERAHKGFEKQEGAEGSKTKMAAKAVLNVLSKLNENVFQKLSIESSYLNSS